MSDPNEEKCEHEPKGHTLEDMMQVGKPLLVEFPSIMAGVMAVKEAAWKAGTEAVAIEADIETGDSIVQRINSTPEGSYVVVSDTASASDEVVDAVKANLGTPRKLIVAEQRGYKRIDPHAFTDIGGHTVKFNVV